MKTNNPSLISYILILLLVILLSTCGGNGENARNPDQTYTFIYANTQTKEHPRSQSMLFFKDKIENSTNGRIKVELHFAGILGKEEEVIDMLRQGIIHGYRGGLFEKANKKYIIYTLPFLFMNTDQVISALESDFGKTINKESLSNGFYIPACGIAGGFRNITNNIRPISSPADLKGLKLRTPPLDITIKTFQVLGAVPQQIAYTDTYIALKEGVVDGQENPFSNIVDMKFFQVQEYLSIVNWQIHPDPFYVNPAWYANLPEELKNLFDKAAQETITYSNGIWLESENKYLKLLEEKLVVNTLPEENIPQFAQAVKSVWEYYIERGFFSRSDIDTINKIIQK